MGLNAITKVPHGCTPLRITSAHLWNILPLYCISQLSIKRMTTAIDLTIYGSYLDCRSHENGHHFVQMKSNGIGIFNMRDNTLNIENYY